MKIYAVVYFDEVSYCSAYYGFYSTKPKAEKGMAQGKAYEDLTYACDWKIKEIEVE